MDPNRSRSRSILSAAVPLLIVAAVLLGSALPAGALTPPTVPAAIQVPAGNTLFLVGHATGYQIYQCTDTGTGFAWVLWAPRAVLTDDAGNVIIEHYAGPTWRANDGSTVVGARVGSAPAPGGAAIPWLLLKAVSTTAGPSGGTTLTQTTYIQRINTTGGLAPTTGCDATHAGAFAPVRYTADYYFYKKA